MADKSDLFLIGIIGMIAVVGMVVMVIASTHISFLNTVVSNEHSLVSNVDSVASSDASGQAIATDLTPRIAYWPGKVNQHINLTYGIWQTDPDGKSGYTISTLTYCQKWYPKTVSVVAYKNETITTWRNGGNTGGPFTSTKLSYKCVQPRVCGDKCSSFGYECGTQTICGVATNCGSCASRGAGWTCAAVTGKCVAPTSVCGDGICSGAESCTSCPKDCSSTCLTSPYHVDLKINGVDNPTSVPYKSKITLTWNSTGNILYCTGFGYYVPVYTTPFRIWFLDTSYVPLKLPPSGSVDLMAAFAYNGHTTDLRLSNLSMGIQCTDGSNIVAEDNVNVTVYSPSAPTCTAGWHCIFNATNYTEYQITMAKAYLLSDCSYVNYTYCPYDCNAGSCRTVTCNDTDGGIDYYNKGMTTVVYKGITRTDIRKDTDFCNDNTTLIPGTLHEFYCGQSDNPGGILRADNYVTCPYGCSNGACIQSTNVTSTCTDSDGLNFSNKGYVTYKTVIYEDYCISQTGVAEEYCNGTQMQVMFTACDAGKYCPSYGTGACIPIP